MTDCEDEDDLSRSQSPMIPLTIENSVIQIKSEPGDEAEADYLEAAGHEDAEEEDEELLNSSLTAMDWLPKLNARAGVVEEFVPEEERKPPYSYASLIRHAILSTRASAPLWRTSTSGSRTRSSTTGTRPTTAGRTPSATT